MNLSNKDSLYDIVPTMIGLEHECDLLREWFKKDYPESELRITAEFNDVLYTLKIQIEVLAGEEVSENRFYFKSRPLFLTERDLRDDGFVYAFLKEFNKQIRQRIQSEFNLHYMKEKQRET